MNDYRLANNLKLLTSYRDQLAALKRLPKRTTSEDYSMLVLEAKIAALEVRVKYLATTL